MEEFLHCYRPHRFNAHARRTVDRAQQIITELREQGYTLTLRQLYYQFVQRNWIPNEEREYKRLGRLVTHARECGEMDWYAIEDRGRSAYGRDPEEDPTEVVNDIELKLKYDYWARQEDYIEVWVEKQALEGVIARPCNRQHVTYMACKGYLSASEAWRAGLRFRDALDRGKRCTLIHLADHDPSGLDMTEDNRNRLQLFAEDQDVTIRRIALNMDQVEQYGPPPNPAKVTDSRHAAYSKRFGPNSWELDALEPKVLDALITDTILEYVDPEKWATVRAMEALARKPLAALSTHWDKVHALLERRDLI